MNFAFGHVQLRITEGPSVKVDYKVTQPMISAATLEAQRIGLDVSESDLQKVLSAALRAA